MAEVTATLKKLIDNEIKDVLPKTRSDVVSHGNTTVSAVLDSKADTNHSHSTASQSANGFMSSTDKAKLDGIFGSGSAIPYASTISYNSSTKVVSATVSGITTLTTGSIFVLKMPSNFTFNSYKMKLDVNALGAKTIYIDGEYTNNGINSVGMVTRPAAGSTIALIYDATLDSNAGGWSVIQCFSNGTTYEFGCGLGESLTNSNKISVGERVIDRRIDSRDFAILKIQEHDAGLTGECSGMIYLTCSIENREVYQAAIVFQISYICDPRTYTGIGSSKVNVLFSTFPNINEDRNNGIEEEKFKITLCTNSGMVWFMNGNFPVSGIWSATYIPFSDKIVQTQILDQDNYYGQSYEYESSSYVVKDTATADLATVSTDGLMSASDKDKLDGIESSANYTKIISQLGPYYSYAVASNTVYYALQDKVDTSTLGAASGVATLDANGKLNSSQIPSGIGGVEWQTLS